MLKSIYLSLAALLFAPINAIAAPSESREIETRALPPHTGCQTFSQAVKDDVAMIQAYYSRPNMADVTVYDNTIIFTWETVQITIASLAPGAALKATSAGIAQALQWIIDECPSTGIGGTAMVSGQYQLYENMNLVVGVQNTNWIVLPAAV